MDKVLYLPKGKFQIINTSPFQEIGEHWLLLARKDNGLLIFYDSFSRPLEKEFPFLYNTLKFLYNISQTHFAQFFPTKTLEQSKNTSLCGLYCIFVAHFIYASKSSNSKQSGGSTLLSMLTYATEDDVLRFANDNFGKNFARKIKYL